MAGILETFFFMFEADASKVKKGSDEGNKSATLLTKTLGSADQAAEKLGDSFKDIIKEGATALLAVASLEAVKSMIEKSAEMTEEVRAASRAAFKSTEDYSAWSNAVVAAGGTAEAFGATMTQLSMRTRTPINYLLRLSDAFKGLSDVRAARLGSWLGIDPGMIHMLQLGRDGITALLKRQLELGVVTKEQAEVARQYTQEMRDWHTLLGDVARRISTAVLPYVTEFTEVLIKVVEFLRDNKTFTIAFFAGVAAIITGMYLPAIMEAIAGTVAFLAPWLLIGAAVAAVAGIFALVFNDINAYLNGQNSMIGELAKKWPIVGIAIHGLVDIFKGFFALVLNGLQFISDLVTKGPAKAFENLGHRAGAALDALIAKHPALGEAMKKLAPVGKLVGDTLGLGWDIAKREMKAVQPIFELIMQLMASGLRLIYDLVTEGPVKAFDAWGERTRAIMDGIAAKFPWLAGIIKKLEGPVQEVAHFIGEAFKIAGEGIEATFHAVAKVIEATFGIIMKGVEKADELVQKMRATLDGPQVAANPVTAAAAGSDVAAGVAANLQQAQTAIQATKTPVNSMTSSSISNTTSNAAKQTTVQIQQIDVNAAGQDPNQVNDALSQGLQQHIRDAIDQHQDGIAG